MSDRFSYEETLERLSWLHHQPVLPAREVGLRRMHRILAELDHPERSFRVVHVAGSSGKGSTTTMIGNVLRAAGFRTGYFRSPHLTSYTERIAVDEIPISEAQWARYFDFVWPIAERMIDNSLPGHELGRPTHGEVLLALMCLHFAAERIEWAAVETGLGGRLDATNVLASEVAVITNVSLEHTHILGSTTREIAREKAAIIKPGADAVTAATDPDALDVVRCRAREVAARLLCVPDDVRYTVTQGHWDWQEIVLSHSSGDLSVRLPVPGTFQAVNAATCAAAIIALEERGVCVGQEAIRRGLGTTRVPGRLEVVSQHPLIVLDGAHNPDAIRQLARALSGLQPEGRVVVLFAAMADKDTETMVAHLAPLVSEVVVTRSPDTERAAAPSRLAASFKGHAVPTEVFDGPEDALRFALGQTAEGDVLVVCGSLYLVGWAREALCAARTAP
ncbi:MAG TPA: folylpolyglutamate synthase/dihydrofolate synthase family protein [Chloroflexota bacterium]|nr:folylpolyglutamate synthase/dihydrofolate synthase family protein [Chloroflexota bacterium]